ncbi:hypothetical protein H310_11087 [Aphanomyces invadans]|uniref:Uncharacterized protein n=1 Tax=Aphanomyces invadans TaxID=157072 RepID=A0A024TNR8_9STRA|nr:hypothetical protein H310_11087 [Aphanomyces invadans]ETV95668.1 hypothetical protein H310_11087 [Aphanomyces invadans]|eukprot:XP_008875861.1 hypothetical protein H310_11087 [Aphanomyces invadans]
MATGEEVLWEWQAEAVALVVEDDSRRLHLTAQGVALLRSYDYPVAVVCVVGSPTRHRIFHAIVEDGMSDGVPPPTPAINGIYMIGSADFMRTGRCMLAVSLVVDLDDDDRHIPLWDLALLLSSLICYVHDGDFSTPPPRLLDTLQVIRQLQPDCAANEINTFLPSLMWATPANASSGAAFHDSVWPFELPLAAVADLSTLDLIGWFLYPLQGSSILDSVRWRILHRTKVKTFLGTELRGDVLVALVDHALSWIYSHHDNAAALQPSLTLDFLGVWDQVVAMQCTAIAEAARIAYEDVMATDAPPGTAACTPPMKLADFDKLHTEMHHVALATYVSQAKTYKSSPAYRRHKQSLVTALQSQHNDHRNALIASSRAYCNAVAQSQLALLACDAASPKEILSPGILPALSPPDGADEMPDVSVDVLQEFVRRFRDATVGQVAADEVLATVVVTDVAAMLTKRQVAAKASWTAAHLESERQALQAAYDSKQSQLTAHFEIEAQKLRDALAAEKKLWMQAHVANQARSNIDVHEAKRLAADLAAATATIAALEEDKRTLQRDVEALHDTIAKLQEQVATLHETIADDNRVRMALVDSVADSIRNEKRLEAAVAAAEAATAAAIAQHRIVVEEKAQLQTTWQQLLVKITALPPGLQEQVLSVDLESVGDGSVGFSDALRRYMSS